jgi:hypothetical protein
MRKQTGYPVRHFTGTLLLILLLLMGLMAARPVVRAQTGFIEPINTGYVRVVNALVGLGSVDIYVDGVRTTLSLEPRSAAPYLSLPVGKHQITARLPGSPPEGAPIADGLVDITANESHTVIVYQKEFIKRRGDQIIATPPIELSGALFVVNDDRSPIALGKTRLTAVHLAVGTPQRLSIGYPSRASLLHEINLEQPYGGIDIDAGRYNLAILDADTTPVPNILLRLDREQDFHSSTLYTLVMVPNVVPPPPSTTGTANTGVGESSAQPTLFVVPAPVDPPQDNGLRLRIFHAARSTDVVDVYVDNRLAAGWLSYGTHTEYLGLANYSHVITLRRSPSTPTDPTLAEARFTINEGNRKQLNWSLMLLNGNDAGLSALPLVQPGGGALERPETIINTPGGKMVMVLLRDNMARTRRDNARVRLINATEGLSSIQLIAGLAPLPRIRAGTPTPTPSPTPDPARPQPPPQPVALLSPVNFGDEATEAEVNSGVYQNLSIVTIANSVIQVQPSKELLDGMVYTFVVIRDPRNPSNLQVVELQDYGIGLPISRLYVARLRAAAQLLPIPQQNARPLLRLERDTEVELLGWNGNTALSFVRARYIRPDTKEAVDGWLFVLSGGNLLIISRLGESVESFQQLPLFLPTPSTGP